jgi:hypothetical protein
MAQAQGARLRSRRFVEGRGNVARGSFPRSFPRSFPGPFPGAPRRQIPSGAEAADSSRSARGADATQGNSAARSQARRRRSSCHSTAGTICATRGSYRACRRRTDARRSTGRAAAGARPVVGSALLRRGLARPPDRTPRAGRVHARHQCTAPGAAEASTGRRAAGHSSEGPCSWLHGRCFSRDPGSATADGPPANGAAACIGGARNATRSPASSVSPASGRPATLRTATLRRWVDATCRPSRPTHHLRVEKRDAGSSPCRRLHDRGSERPLPGHDGDHVSTVWRPVPSRAMRDV